METPRQRRSRLYKEQNKRRFDLYYSQNLTVNKIAEQEGVQPSAISKSIKLHTKLLAQQNEGSW